MEVPYFISIATFPKWVWGEIFYLIYKLGDIVSALTLCVWTNSRSSRFIHIESTTTEIWCLLDFITAFKVSQPFIKTKTRILNKIIIVINTNKFRFW